MSDFEGLEDKFLNETKFFHEVEEEVEAHDISYIEATLNVCEKFGLDYDDLVKQKLIVPALKSKLLKEGMESGQLKQQKTITFD